MSVRFPIASFLFVLCALAAQAFAGPPQGQGGRALAPGRLSAANLTALCEGGYDIDVGFCAGYVTAIADLMGDQPLYGFRACLLGPVRSQQLMDNVTGILRASPDRARFAARTVVAESLSRSFPCY
mgnify:CR=1 FL=1